MLYTYQAGAFTEFGGVGSIAAGSGCTPHVAGVGRRLVICTSSGLYHAGDDSYQDGYLISSWLDMGHPGKVKRLEQITVLTNVAKANFSIVLKYKADDDSAYTTAATRTNTRRAVASSIGASFYSLLLRVEIDDDSGNHEHVKILAVSVTYTIDD